MAEETTFQSVFGQTPGQLGLGAAGTFAGGALNYFFNSKLQDKQFAEQEKLQRNAAKLNAQAVRQQAQLQAQGMSNAGLNPASVNGVGAPSVQAGAAAGANTQLATIFQGVAEIVAASKAPEEVKNIQADTGLKQADTGLKEAQTENVKTDTTLIKPAQHEELVQLANKHVAEASHHTASADNIQQMTDLIQNRDDFLRKYSGSLYSGYMDNLKMTGQWEKLSPRTRETIEQLASGDIDVGIGELEAIKDLVDSQQGLMDADKNIVKDMIETVVARKQINDKEVMDAFVKLPKNQQDLMVAEMLKAAADASRTTTLEWLDQHTSDEWLIEHGMEEDFKRRKYKDIINNITKLTDPHTYTNVLGGALIGRGLRGAGKAKSLGPTYPSDKGNIFTGGLRGYQESGPIKKNSPWNQPSKFKQYNDLSD